MREENNDNNQNLKNNINNKINNNLIKNSNFYKNYKTKPSKINPEIEYIINHSSKFNNFNINFLPNFFPFNSFYSFDNYDYNLLLNDNLKPNYNYMSSQNSLNCNDNFKTDNSIDKYQESNSMSYLSTTSEGEQGINNNNKFFYHTIPEEKKLNKKCKNKNENLSESIAYGIKEISDYFNSNKNESNVISFACYYFCDINMNEEEEFFLGVNIRKIIKEYEKKIAPKK